MSDDNLLSNSISRPSASRDFKEYKSNPSSYRQDARNNYSDTVQPTDIITRRFNSEDAITLGPRVSTVRDTDGVPISWDTIRKHYVVGDRVQLKDGSWANEKITLTELARHYNLSNSSVKSKAKKENWGKLREAYIARVQERNMGLELSFYTQENFDNETTAMNSAQKLNRVLETYIDTKYATILKASDSLEDMHIEDDEVIQTEFNRVNNNTGVSVFITELQSTVKVAESIYNLQRKIYVNAQEEDPLDISDITKKPKYKNERERETKLNQLRQRLLMSQSTQDVETAIYPTIPVESIPLDDTE